MIHVTKKAQEQLINALTDNSTYKYVRLGVQGGGCSGFEYSLGLIEEPNLDWEKFEYSGLTIFIDQMSLMYLDGVELDYVEDLMQAGFKFNNPQVKSVCGCGHSFSV